MGMIHSRLCQVFPGRSSQPFGGTSLILVGDFGQLPPVGDTPLYMAAAKGVLSNKGRAMYIEFGAAVELTQVMRQAGSDPAQVRFKEALLRVRKAEVTEDDDWHLFMTRTARAAQRNGEDLTRFVEAIRLFPTVERVAEYILARLHRLNSPIAHIKAVHNCAEAKKAYEVEDGGLHSTVFLSEGSRVM